MSSLLYLNLTRTTCKGVRQGQCLWSVPMLTHAAVSAAQRTGRLEPRGARQRWLPLKRKAGTFLPRIALMVLFPCSNAGEVGGWGENRATDSSWVLTRTFHSFLCMCVVCMCACVCACVWYICMCKGVRPVCEEVFSHYYMHECLPACRPVCVSLACLVFEEVR